MIARGLNEKEFRYLLLSYTGYGFGLNVLNRVEKSAIFVLNRVRVWGAVPHLPSQGYIEYPPGSKLTQVSFPRVNDQLNRNTYPEPKSTWQIGKSGKDKISLDFRLGWKKNCSNSISSSFQRTEKTYTVQVVEHEFPFQERQFSFCKSIHFFSGFRAIPITQSKGQT